MNLEGKLDNLSTLLKLHTYIDSLLIVKIKNRLTDNLIFYEEDSKNITVKNSFLAGKRREFEEELYDFLLNYMDDEYSIYKNIDKVSHKNINLNELIRLLKKSDKLREEK